MILRFCKYIVIALMLVGFISTAEAVSYGKMYQGRNTAVSAPSASGYHMPTTFSSPNKGIYEAGSSASSAKAYRAEQTFPSYGGSASSPVITKRSSDNVKQSYSASGYVGLTANITNVGASNPSENGINHTLASVSRSSSLHRSNRVYAIADDYEYVAPTMMREDAVEDEEEYTPGQKAPLGDALLPLMLLAFAYVICFLLKRRTNTAKEA